MIGWIWGAAAAMAGSGPWVVGDGQASLYTGVETQRITTLAVTVDDERDVLDVGQGLTSFGVKAIATLGLTDRGEIEAQLPWWTVRANRRDEPLCGLLGLQACATTTSVGVLMARAKVLVLDEYFGAPVSLSLGGEFRYGDFTAPTRARITNVGEGTTDLGPWLAVGRVGTLGGRGVISGFLEAGWRYRFPTTRAYPDAQSGQRAAPLPEAWTNLEVVAGPSTRIGFGPAFSFLYRNGLDWGELDLTDPDRLAALRVVTARAGALVVIHNDGDLAFVVSALQAIATRNNPNALSVNVGVSLSGLTKNRDE